MVVILTQNYFAINPHPLPILRLIDRTKSAWGSPCIPTLTWVQVQRGTYSSPKPPRKLNNRIIPPDGGHDGEAEAA